MKEYAHVPHRESARASGRGINTPREYRSRGGGGGIEQRINQSRPTSSSRPRADPREILLACPNHFEPRALTVAVRWLCGIRNGLTKTGLARARSVAICESRVEGTLAECLTVGCDLHHVLGQSLQALPCR